MRTLAAATAIALAALAVPGCRREPAESGEAAAVRETPKPRALPVAVRFTGSFTSRGEARKVTHHCPYCAGLILDLSARKCPRCGKEIAWPKEVKCGFCGGSGACAACRGDGRCPVCSKAPPMLMGVKPPCDTCQNSGTCPACKGSGKCGFCRGGLYRPGESARLRAP